MKLKKLTFNLFGCFGIFLYHDCGITFTQNDTSITIFSISCAEAKFIFIVLKKVMVEYIIKKLKNPLFKIKKYIFRQKYKAVF